MILPLTSKLKQKKAEQARHGAGLSTSAAWADARYEPCESRGGGELSQRDFGWKESIVFGWISMVFGWFLVLFWGWERSKVLVPGWMASRGICQELVLEVFKFEDLRLTEWVLSLVFWNGGPSPGDNSASTLGISGDLGENSGRSFHVFVCFDWRIIIG